MNLNVVWKKLKIQFVLQEIEIEYKGRLEYVA